MGMSFDALFTGERASSRAADLEDIRRDIEELYQLRRDSVFRYLVASSRNPAEAEEITHDAFLRLYLHYVSGRSVDQPLRWLCTVGHNLLINRLKRRKFEVDKAESVWNVVTRTRSASGPTPEESLLANARNEEMKRALDSLEGLERDCLHLKIKGLPFRVIADRLDIQMWVAVDQTNRAIAKVRRCFKV